MYRTIDVGAGMDQGAAWAQLLGGGMPLFQKLAVEQQHPSALAGVSMQASPSALAHAQAAPLRAYHQAVAAPHLAWDPAALVQSALAVLELEAGLSNDTMATLRHAVASGMARKKKHEMEKMANAAVAAMSAAAASSMTHPVPRAVKPASSKRQQLTVEEAAEIYTLRPRKHDGQSERRRIHCRFEGTPLAPARRRVAAACSERLHTGRCCAVVHCATCPRAKTNMIHRF